MGVVGRGLHGGHRFGFASNLTTPRPTLARGAYIRCKAHLVRLAVEVEDIILARADQAATRRHKKREVARSNSAARGGSALSSTNASTESRHSNSDEVSKPEMRTESGAQSRVMGSRGYGYGDGDGEGALVRAIGTSAGVSSSGEEGFSFPPTESSATSGSATSSESGDRGEIGTGPRRMFSAIGAAKRSGDRTRGAELESAVQPLPFERRLRKTLIIATGAQSSLIADELLLLRGLRVEAAAHLGLDYEAKVLFHQGTNGSSRDEGGDEVSSRKAEDCVDEEREGGAVAEGARLDERDDHDVVAAR